MAIARSSFEQYCAAVDKLASSAAAAVESEVLAWCSSNPGASTAAAREAAKAIMSGYMSVSNAAAASLAAEWYDETVGSSSSKIASAITEATYSDELVDKVARYQVRNYEDGDVAAFARNCGELASNDAKRALNDTIVGNAARDRTKGVRFARVCTGAETCAFCLMLSTRGAVYYTRQTAGEQNHYHRNCDCKIVAGVESDPYAEIVEGYSALDIKARMALIEERTGLSLSDKEELSLLSEELKLYDMAWLHYGDDPADGFAIADLAGYDKGAYLARAFETLDEVMLYDYMRDAIETGAAAYEKPLDAFKGRDEARDLFAHAALVADGREIVIRVETQNDVGLKNPDILVDGTVWEVKSPTSSGSGRSPLRFVERAVAKARHQCDEAVGGSVSRQLVFNSAYTAVDDSAIADRLLLEKARQGMSAILMVCKDGSVTSI